MSDGQWTPDGKHFVFSSHRDGESNIYELVQPPWFEFWRKPHAVRLTAGDINVLAATPSHDSAGLFVVGQIAQGAMQGGSHAAKVIRRRVLGRPHEPFRYSDHGDAAVIGRLSGVTNISWLGPFGQQGGFPAWALWLGIHIFYLIGFSNRLVVLIRWAWTFLTHGRGMRLITGATLLTPIEEPEPPVMAPFDPDDDPRSR
jgi:hypothetical protein